MRDIFIWPQGFQGIKTKKDAEILLIESKGSLYFNDGKLQYCIEDSSLLFRHIEDNSIFIPYIDLGCDVDTVYRKRKYINKLFRNV